MALVYAGPGKEVVVPLDVEAGVIAWLRAMGIWASTRVPTQRVAGMIRVSRVGGEPIKDMARDEPTMLVEVWGKDQGESFDMAQRLFGLFVYAGQYQAIPAIGLVRARPSPPVTLEDDYAPELYRHQFTVSMTTQMGRLTV